MKAKFLYSFRPKHAIQRRLETGSSALYTLQCSWKINYDQLLLYPSFAFWLNKKYKKQHYLPLRFALSVPCLLAFRFSPFQGDLIRFFCALTKFEMQRAELT